MKITMLRNPARTLGCELKEGETGVVSKELGRKLVKLRIAVTDDPEILAIPDDADIAGGDGNDEDGDEEKKPSRKRRRAKDESGDQE
jgi:hypothetical protein